MVAGTTALPAWVTVGGGVSEAASLMFTGALAGRPIVKKHSATLVALMQVTSL